MAANFSGQLPPNKTSSAPHQNPHHSSTESSQKPKKSFFGKARKKPNTTCSCSNIHIMQLFHEMKQEYPTVPDHVVSQLVSENCHDRIKCMEKLTEVEEEYVQTTQAFPSHSIRYNKPPTPPRRCKNVQRQQQISPETPRRVIETPKPEVVRPNFLALRNEVSLPYTRKAPTPPKPTRAAPPPPISATAAITTDHEPLNVSLNVTVSPVPQRRNPPRHTSELNVQPEMPYSPAPSSPSGSSPRSYTSVNFTLRPPSEENVQSPIDICAGPSLTYSSSSYDARQGYQSSLKITVGGPAGPAAFSAMRTRARAGAHEDPQNVISSVNRALKGSGFVNSDSRGVTSPLREDEVVRRQLDRKRDLDNELQRDKHNQENIEYEILILQAKFSTSDLERLIEEIRLLQRECDFMTDLLDKNGVVALGDTATAGYFSNNVLGNRNITSGSGSLKPPRPPFPAAFRTVTSPQRPTVAPPFCPSPTAYSFRPSAFFPEDSVAESEQPWTCSACTFHNHPLLNKCEQCEVQRGPPGTVPSSLECSPMFSAAAPLPYYSNGTGPAPFSPAFNNLMPNLHPELMPVSDAAVCDVSSSNTSNASGSSSRIGRSVGDLPAAIKSVFKKGHRQTPSM